jgi:cation transport ATPase
LSSLSSHLKIEKLALDLNLTITTIMNSQQAVLQVQELIRDIEERVNANNVNTVGNASTYFIRCRALVENFFGRNNIHNTHIQLISQIEFKTSSLNNQYRLIELLPLVKTIHTDIYGIHQKENQEKAREEKLEKQNQIEQQELIARLFSEKDEALRKVNSLEDDIASMSYDLKESNEAYDEQAKLATQFRKLVAVINFVAATLFMLLMKQTLNPSSWGFVASEVLLIVTTYLVYTGKRPWTNKKLMQRLGKFGYDLLLVTISAILGAVFTLLIK